MSKRIFCANEPEESTRLFENYYNDQIDQMKNKRIIHSQLIVAHIYLPSLGASTESVWNTSRKGLIKDATVLSKNKLFFNLILLYFFILCLPIADTSALNDPPE